MKAAINFVRGAIAKKSMTPVLTHIRVYNGRVQGGNDRYSIDAPCPELAGYDFCVPADRFCKAVDACDGEPNIKMTDGGKVTLSKGKFRAILPTTPVEDYPLAIRGQGEEGIILGDWLPPLKALTPFLGEDDKKPWCMGAWLANDGFMYALNGTSAARVPSPWSSANEQLILPGFIIDELLRLGKEPLQILYAANQLTITFEDDSWIKGRLLEGQFPESVKTLISPAACVGEPCEELAAALKRIVPFCPDPIFPLIVMSPEGLSTAEGEMSAMVGGLSLPDMRWNADVLGLALANATACDFSMVPCQWVGANGLAGVSLPVR